MKKYPTPVQLPVKQQRGFLCFQPYCLEYYCMCFLYFFCRVSEVTIQCFVKDLQEIETSADKPKINFSLGCKGV